MIYHRVMIELRHEISNNVESETSKASDQPALIISYHRSYTQSDQSLCYSLEYFMSVKLLTVRHLKFLSIKGGCTGSSESTLVKIPHCWKSHIGTQ